MLDLAEDTDGNEGMVLKYLLEHVHEGQGQKYGSFVFPLDFFASIAATS